jgi:hypothetical protein
MLRGCPAAGGAGGFRRFFLRPIYEFVSNSKSRNFVLTMLNFPSFLGKWNFNMENGGLVVGNDVFLNLEVETDLVS